MLETLDQIDLAWFKTVNIGLANEFFDVFLPFMRNEMVWIPMYLMMVVFLIWKYKKKGIAWVIWCLATIGLADFTSSQLMKKYFIRARPCQIEDDIPDMVLRVICGTGYSFTSSHATNHMALAVFVIVTTAMIWKGWRWAFLPWALIVGFAQIYVGVHYPFDVMGGFLLGSLIAGAAAWGFNYSRWGFK